MGSSQGVNYKRGRGGADLFAIDQNPRMYLSSETLRVGSKCQLFTIPSIDQSPRNYQSLVFIGSKCQFTKRGRGGTDLP